MHPVSLSMQICRKVAHMKWISILGDRNLTLAGIQRMKHPGAVRTYEVSADRFCVEYPDGHIFFDYDTDLSDWQDALEKQPFQAEQSSRSFINILQMFVMY